MHRIYKYVLLEADNQSIGMPTGAEILSVGEQNGELVMWARVNPDNPHGLRNIVIKGTGHPIGAHELGRFIGTVIMLGGRLVWHVFEEAR